jgi:hypothetical protein
MWNNTLEHTNFNNYVQYNNNKWNYKQKKNIRMRYSAGVLPYTFDNSGTCLILLGKDNDGDWSDFGGKCEYKDKNDEKVTAAREFFEETLGSVIGINECIEKINENENKVLSQTLNGSPYHMFLLKVDYLNYSEIFNKTSNFIKYYHSQNSSSTNSSQNINKILEKTSIRWVSVDTLRNCIENNQFSKPLSLRGVFYKTIKKSINELNFNK